MRRIRPYICNVLQSLELPGNCQVRRVVLQVLQRTCSLHKLKYDVLSCILELTYMMNLLISVF